MRRFEFQLIFHIIIYRSVDLSVVVCSAMKMFLGSEGIVPFLVTFWILFTKLVKRRGDISQIRIFNPDL